jgi:hypothetical protein
MDAHPLIAARLTPDIKARLHALAQRHQLSDSAFLRRLIEAALLSSAEITADRTVQPIEPLPRNARVFVRLRPEDHLLLRERASGRGLATATYASIVLRVHLRNAAPIPNRELGELKRTVAALSAIGRNLNQMARCTNQGTNATGQRAPDLRTFLKVCEAVRDHVKDLIKSNIASWEGDRGATNR